MHQSRRLIKLLEPAFEIQTAIDAFQYRTNRDLSGYEDGTENPTGDAALEAGFVKNKGAGLDGSSFLALQQWVHDLDFLDSQSTQAQDHIFGRQISDNEEIEDAPASAHVKRTAQEDFKPQAFVLRRSMPWANEDQMGLVFTAFGHSFDAFEALLNRMLGKDDGIVDALFTFTRPLSGSYFWTPPMKEGKLDLSALRL
jgi:putative iron-dependent peroxidase